jgi:hypothetical protein
MQRFSLAKGDLGNKRHIVVTLRIVDIFSRHHCKKMKRRMQFRVHAMEAQRGSRGTATFTVNILNPNGFFTFHQFEYSKILHGVHIALSVLYGSQNRQRLSLYTLLTDWFL